MTTILTAAQVAAVCAEVAGRGSGSIYAGSVEELHGAVCVDMWDCTCQACRQYPHPWDARVRVNARVVSWDGSMVLLEHARCASFTWPRAGRPAG